MVKLMKKSKIVTLADVAKASGVSLKTASRVLNDAPNIRPATAARVRESMQALGYEPNELARGLKSKHSGAIAMIAPNIADPFSAAAIQAVQDVAREHQTVVMLASSGGDAALEASELQFMARRQIDGLILMAANSRENNLKPLLAKDVPIVVVDEPVHGERVDTITVSNRKAARGATQHLIEHRYKRILAVGARPFLYTCSERIAGYRAAMRAAGLVMTEMLVEHERELTPQKLRPYLCGAERVDAIFTLNWVCTMGVLRGLREMKKRIPSDVALISFDDFELAEMIPPGLTVVRQPTHGLGAIAAQTLFERLKDDRGTPARRIVLETEFIVRGSCGCAPVA